MSKTGGRKGDSFLSPTLQREQIAAVARREGLEVVEIIQEQDVSGRNARRPGWNRAIEIVERGEADGIAVWNLSRFSRSVKDALTALDRIEAAGGRVWSSTEDFGDGPSGRMVRTILLAVAENESERVKAGFAAATASAIQRGAYLAGTIPIGYRRGPDKRLVLDPDTAPVVLGVFERRVKGWSWVRLARWLAEQGHPRTESGVKSIVRNVAYLGQARYGDLVKEHAHEAIVPRGLWQKCQEKQKPSARSGRLTQRYLLQGIATCASCGRVMYLSGGNRPKDAAHYICHRLECGEHAYARAEQLDAFVLNTIEERLTGVDYDGVRTSEGASEEAWRAATWVARPGGDDADVEKAEDALEEARAELDSFLADTKLRSIVGPDKHAEAAANYVAVVNKADADLAEARERSTGSYELVGRLWLTEWGWAERREWLERMLKAAVVSRGREPLSERCEVELR